MAMLVSAIDAILAPRRQGRKGTTLPPIGPIGR
jgi:hypothetical protein